MQQALRVKIMYTRFIFALQSTTLVFTHVIANKQSYNSDVNSKSTITTTSKL